MKIVEVHWRDITYNNGWNDADEADEFIHEDNSVIQVGILYEEDDEQIVLLDSYFKNKERFGGIHKIPRGCIIGIYELGRV